MNEIKNDRASALGQVKSAKKEALNQIGKASGGNSNGSVWLIMHQGQAGTGTLEKIQVKDMNQCEIMGAKWKNSSIVTRASKLSLPTQYWLNYVCLRGS